MTVTSNYSSSTSGRRSRRTGQRGRADGPARSKRLLDAVLSIRANYGSEATGVRAAVSRWRQHRGASLDELTELVAVDPAELEHVLHNRQVLSSGARKAEAITRAAAALVAVGVRHAADLDPSQPEHRSAYVGITGLGPVTWEYFCMLLGGESVKADVWIRRFVDQAVGPRNADEARQLMTAAASRLDVTATALDHAIWDCMRG